MATETRFETGSSKAVSDSEAADLLTVEQMAQFVLDGYLEFDNLIPEELNQAVYEDQLKSVSGSELKDEFRWHQVDNPNGFYEHSAAVREVHNLPAVKAIVQSLVGPKPRHNHSAMHVTPPHKQESQQWHVDGGGRRKTRLKHDHPYHFDVLTAYFTHDVPYEMGPTLILPGSHMRHVLGGDVARYKNVVGQKRLEGKGGRIAFIHDAMWHCAQPNQTDKTRFMFKIQFRPSVPQQNLFNTEGWASQEIRNYFLRHRTKHSLTGEWSAQAPDMIDWWHYLCGQEPLHDPSGLGTPADVLWLE
jgi:ectoine hydroxylase-related dioxygenase (phytanoyl-CoA dioxygenase family)